MPGDANETFDIFVKDLRTGRVTLASANADGDEGDSFSFAPSISANGRHVAFHSAASNLVPGDTNRAIDVFVKDLLTGEVALASADVSGNQGDGSSAFASISANGRLVAFQSSASNLARGDDNRATDVFVKNLETGALTLASANERGTEGDSGSFRPSISDNGRYVAFESAASNLVLDDTNGTSDIFLRDLRTSCATCGPAS